MDTKKTLDAIRKFSENNNTWYYKVCRFKKRVTFLEIYHSPQNWHTMTIK